MIDVKNITNRHRITQAEKDENDKKWYKEQADLLDTYSYGTNSFMGFGGISEYRRKKVNYDLFNNIIDIRELQYVCSPYGTEVGELPANLTNRDIVSGKIKVLLGMEMKMPFDWKVVAVNEEATTRKEQQEFGMIRDYVVNQVTAPIKMQLQQQAMEESRGKKLTPEEQQRLKQQMQEQLNDMTPDEVRRYMTREHQDPAEVLGQQLLQYLTLKCKINNKFNKGWKHMNLSGEQMYWVGILNGEPDMWVVNPLFFNYGKSDDTDFIEDSEWATYEMRMTPSEVVASFGSELTDDEIDRIYQFNQNPASINDIEFTFEERESSVYTVRVLHTTWRSLRKIGFLTYKRKGQEEMMIVDENYRLNNAQGDIKIEWEWIPEAHEVYKILNDIYVYGRAVPGQAKDLNNLYDCKLSYFGAACDNLNSPVTSPMDRMKSYQYLYDIIIYRIELLMASDKGKILAANINAIPKSAGIDTTKFMYFMEANKIAWFNPNEEGNKGADVTNLVKEIDMSLVSDISKYMNIADYIERKCGNAIGVTPQMEAQIGPNEAVSNTRQNLVQSSHIIQPYFELHNIIKGNVITALLEKAKVAYSQGDHKVLSYVLDDMSVFMLTLDKALLDNSIFGLFVTNSTKADEAKQAVTQLSQAALQNQQADLSDIIKVIRSNSVNEAEELLEASQRRKADEQMKAQREKIQAEQDAEARADERLQKQWDHDEQMVVLKEEEKRKTDIQKQTIFSMGFDQNKDEDNDGIPDVLEVARDGVNADIQRQKLDIERDKLQHSKEVDSEKLKIENKKLAMQKAKPTSGK